MKGKWIEGSCLNDYNLNAKKWKEYTSRVEFANDFKQIL
jgi:hypothetical protein